MSAVWNWSSNTNCTIFFLISLQLRKIQLWIGLHPQNVSNGHLVCPHIVTQSLITVGEQAAVQYWLCSLLMVGRDTGEFHTAVNLLLLLVYTVTLATCPLILLAYVTQTRRLVSCATSSNDLHFATLGYPSGQRSAALGHRHPPLHRGGDGHRHPHPTPLRAYQRLKIIIKKTLTGRSLRI